MGNLIQERRRSRQLSAGEVARLLGVSEWTVRSWEADRTRPTRRHAKALARVLKVTVEDLGLEAKVASVDLPGAELKPLAAAIIVRDGRVLLTERRFPGHGEQWSWPSGKVEGGESLEDAVLRELHEELLVSDARVLAYVGDIDLPSGYRMSHYHVSIPQDAEPVLNDYEQLVRLQWMTREEARQAFGSLAPEIAGKALVYLDQVLGGPADPADHVAGRPDVPQVRVDPLAEARAKRKAERDRWARESESSPPGEQPGGHRPGGRPMRP